MWSPKMGLGLGGPFPVFGVPNAKKKHERTVLYGDHILRALKSFYVLLLESLMDFNQLA